MTMKRQSLKPRFAVCINNEGYSASLELRKIYQVLPDVHATEHKCMRVIDESGEDYVYPAEYFVLVDLPQAVKKTFSLAT